MKDRKSLKRYLVILADRQKARFFTIFMNNFEDQSEEIIDDDVPQKVKVEHTRPGKVQAHIKDHLYRHLKRVGKEALSFLIKNRVRGISGVVLSSHKELLSYLKRFLPSNLKNKVVLEMVSEMNTPTVDLTNKIVKKINI